MTQKLAKDGAPAIQARDMKYKLIWRNNYRSDTCLLMRLLVHLRLSGALANGKGPIFGNMDSKTGLMLVADHKVTHIAPVEFCPFFITSIAFDFPGSDCPKGQGLRRVL